MEYSFAATNDCEVPKSTTRLRLDSFSNLPPSQVHLTPAGGVLPSPTTTTKPSSPTTATTPSRAETASSTATTAPSLPTTTIKTLSPSTTTTTTATQPPTTTATTTTVPNPTPAPLLPPSLQPSPPTVPQESPTSSQAITVLEATETTVPQAAATTVPQESPTTASQATATTIPQVAATTVPRAKATTVPPAAGTTAPQATTATTVSQVSPQNLPNIGSSYVSAILQCLNSIRELSNYFVYSYYVRDLKQDNLRNIEVVESLVHVFSALRHSEPATVVVREFTSILGKYDHQFQGRKQQDAHDFLCVVLACLHDALSMIFHGEQEFRIVCPRSQRIISCTREPFVSLSLAVNMTRNWSLQDLLRNHFRMQGVEWQCEVCKREHLCYKYTFIVVLPVVLIIHLSRYEHLALQGRKNLVEYPEKDLLVNSYPSVDTFRTTTYNLVSACYHVGTTTSGHYSASCLSKDDQVWYLYQDDQVVRQGGRHHRAAHAAHILFYYAKCETDPRPNPRQWDKSMVPGPALSRH
ncbi:ubiquitin carboxyl-terminal hydrolase 2 isoform X2 [Cherax quadricarinatus]|uniref:ubiquitin carboxyl-terminal hydrolase 2 isoform X2 n=1 Tax=Cherax quadricarinatus TaxID=27406 RepID=UPI002378F983|nr:ubiquitin carboxyl-terminal hydrolase 2-like isoform X2 [Cherax quadricarinatus]